MIKIVHCTSVDGLVVKLVETLPKEFAQTPNLRYRLRLSSLEPIRSWQAENPAAFEPFDLRHIKFPLNFNSYMSAGIHLRA